MSGETDYFRLCNTFFRSINPSLPTAVPDHFFDTENRETWEDLVDRLENRDSRLLKDPCPPLEGLVLYPIHVRSPEYTGHNRQPLHLSAHTRPATRNTNTADATNQTQDLAILYVFAQAEVGPRQGPKQKQSGARIFFEGQG